MIRAIQSLRRRYQERQRLASARAAIRAAERRIAQRKRLADQPGYDGLLHPLVMGVLMNAVIVLLVV